MNDSAKDLDGCMVHPDQTVKEALIKVNQNAMGIALVCERSGKLIQTLTDGDFRRWVLHGRLLDAPVQDMLHLKTTTPITGTANTAEQDLLHIMNTNSLRHIPIVDEDGLLLDLVQLKDLAKEYETRLQAVVMAGGRGKRLYPLTEDTPKPMLKVGDRPVLEHIIRQLGTAGIRRVNITTHYMPEKITEHFGDGSAFDVDLQYVTEEQPLGTAGSLSLIDEPDEPVLVMNGDIVTKIDFQAMHHFHMDHKADMTVAVRQYDIDIPYGVVETEDVQVVALREKPNMKFFVNAGIYLLQPSVFSMIPTDGTRFDMTELIEKLIAEGKSVVSFPVSEYWLDIGHHEDYQKAQDDLQPEKSEEGK